VLGTANPEDLARDGENGLAAREGAVVGLAEGVERRGQHLEHPLVEHRRAIVAAAPLVGLPILDTTMVLVSRARRGAPLFSGAATISGTVARAARDTSARGSRTGGGPMPGREITAGVRQTKA